MLTLILLRFSTNFNLAFPNVTDSFKFKQSLRAIILSIRSELQFEMRSMRIIYYAMAQLQNKQMIIQEMKNHLFKPLLRCYKVLNIKAPKK